MSLSSAIWIKHSQWSFLVSWDGSTIQTPTGCAFGPVYSQLTNQNLNPCQQYQEFPSVVSNSRLAEQCCWNCSELLFMEGFKKFDYNHKLLKVVIWSLISRSTTRYVFELPKLEANSQFQIRNFWEYDLDLPRTHHTHTHAQSNMGTRSHTPHTHQLLLPFDEVEPPQGKDVAAGAGVDVGWCSYIWMEELICEHMFEVWSFSSESSLGWMGENGSFRGAWKAEDCSAVSRV